VGKRELDAVAQMREAVQMVETAALEKEQVFVTVVLHFISKLVFMNL